MVPRQYVHLLLLISELLIIIALLILIVKGFRKDWKHKIWIGSKILTIEKIMFNNSYRLYPLLSIEPEIRYNYSYDYLLKHSRKNCEENYKKCGILDTYGNVMCIPEKDDCPINDIIVNFDNEELSRDNKKLDSSEYTLSYINTAIDKPIIVKYQETNEIPKYINDLNLIFDQETYNEYEASHRSSSSGSSSYGGGGGVEGEVEEEVLEI